MVWAAPAAIALGLCFSANLGKAAAAALIMGAVQFTTEQHPNLSASLLQGFPCVPASDVPTAAVLAFAQGLQSKPVELSAAQLSCLARLLAAKNLMADFSQYPPDLLLFFDLAELDAGTCKAFYTRASRGNLELLPRGSAQRTGLLRGALTCLGVRSSRLSREQLSSLGGLVCDMEPETITASDPGILENLKLCPALTGAQQDALNTVLLGGGTAYGDPSSWDLQTLQNLGPLVLALNQTTLSLVAEAVREAFGRSIAAAYGSQGRAQQEKSLAILRALAALSRPRLKRNTDGCPHAPITADIISDPVLILIDYETAEQFDLCLSSDVVKTNLEALLDLPLTEDYIWVVKRKLDQAYPSGLPDEPLKLLGFLSCWYTAEEISRWCVRSNDTLLALLNPKDCQWEDAQVQQLIKRYLDLGGILTGPLLQEIGGEKLCNLQEEDINRISPEAIRTAGQLNISSCSQTKKDKLCQIAQEAFADQAGSTVWSPPVTCTTQPAPTTPCSIHPAVTSSTATSPTVTLLSTILATVKPSATSPSSVPPPAVTHGVTTTSVVPNLVVTTQKTSTLLVSSNPPAPVSTIHPTPATPNTITTTSVVPNLVVTTQKNSTLLVSSNPPAPVSTIHPTPATSNTVTTSTPSSPSTPVPHSSSAPTEMNTPPQPTPSPHSTQKTVASSTAETTTLDCVTGTPPASPSPSSTNTASETSEKPVTSPTGSPGDNTNPKPEPDSGSHLSPCLVSILTVAMGMSLLRGLL